MNKEVKPPKSDWHHHPDLPLTDKSIFQDIKNPKTIWQWFVQNWLSLSEFVLLALLSVLLYVTMYPALTAANQLEWSWVLQTYLVNLILVAAFAGSLHAYFLIYRKQKLQLKFDARAPTRNNRAFLFSDQVKDNVFWTLTSGVFFLTLFQCIAMWLMANDFAPLIAFPKNAVLFLLGFVLIPIWSAFHFYWIHRFLHVPFMYKRFHSLHHKNVNVGPWSGLAMHPVEHILYISSLSIHFILGGHPAHIIFHVVWLGPGAIMSHTGYESLLIKDKPKLALGTFYHQLHHRFFECNYGNQEMPWDRWFGTFHDGSDAATIATRQRRKRMHS